LCSSKFLTVRRDLFDFSSTPLYRTRNEERGGRSSEEKKEKNWRKVGELESFLGGVQASSV
jgi:hypothetical protein